MKNRYKLVIDFSLPQNFSPVYEFGTAMLTDLVTILAEAEIVACMPKSPDVGYGISITILVILVLAVIGLVKGRTKKFYIFFSFRGIFLRKSVNGKTARKLKENVTKTSLKKRVIRRMKSSQMKFTLRDFTMSTLR